MAHLISSRPDRESNVTYRQLVSRAVTQRLHSPSLSTPFPILPVYDTWEFSERLGARVKAQSQIASLGVPWSTFIQDVNDAERESHVVLSPRRYEVNKAENEEAAQRNRKVGYVFDQVGLEMFANLQLERMRMLEVYGKARMGVGM